MIFTINILYLNTFLIIIQILRNLNVVNANFILYPDALNVAIFKPVQMSPIGCTCGLNIQDTLCDNRLQNSKICSSNDSSIINCLQTCPYGTVLLNVSEQIDQLELEYMQPCQILKGMCFITLIFYKVLIQIQIENMKNLILKILIFVQNFYSRLWSSFN